MLRRSFLAAALAPTFALAPSFAFGPTFAFAQAQPKADPENTLVIELKSGRVVIALRPDLAPKHVERIKMLARKGFYDGIVFHRVLDGFMAQTGDPTGTGMGGSDLGNLPAEFSRTERYVRGTVGMARTQDPNSANSQFFIMFAEAPGLNGQYTIWGRVVEGMEHVDRIRRVDPQRERVPKEQLDKMIRVRVAADIR